MMKRSSNPERGNIIAAQRDDRGTTEVIPDNATSLQDVDDEVTQASKPDRSTEDNFDEAPDDED